MLPARGAAQEKETPLASLPLAAAAAPASPWELGGGRGTGRWGGQRRRLLYTRRRRPPHRVHCCVFIDHPLVYSCTLPRTSCHLHQEQTRKHFGGFSETNRGKVFNVIQQQIETSCARCLSLRIALALWLNFNNWGGGQLVVHGPRRYMCSVTHQVPVQDNSHFRRMDDRNFKSQPFLESKFEIDMHMLRVP